MNKIIGSIRSVPALLFLALAIVSNQAHAQLPNPRQIVGAPITLPGQFSVSGPAVVLFGSTLFMAYTGVGSHQLNVTYSSDGTTWHAPIVSPTTQYSVGWAGPGLTVFNGRLYMVWTGGSNDINIISSGDGLNWDWSTVRQVAAPNGTIQTAAGSPAIFAANGMLYLAWAGTDVSHSVQYANSTDGANWGYTFIAGNSNYSPSLSGYGTSVYMAWTNSGNTTLALNVDNGHWATTGSLNTYITIGPHGPGNYQDGSILYTAFGGLPNGNQGGSVLYWSAITVTSNTGTGNALSYQPFSGSEEFGVVGNPALVKFNNHLYIFFTSATSGSPIMGLELT